MQPVINMADAEAAVIGFLRQHLDASVRVGKKIPNPVPDFFIQVRRIGGSTDSKVLDKPRIDCLVFHDADAAVRKDLAIEVHALLLAIANDTVGDALLYSARDFLAPIDVPDPVDESRQVTMLTVEITMRKSAQA